MNMKSSERLIRAKDLIEYINCGHLRSPTEVCFSELDVVNMIDKMPTVNAVVLPCDIKTTVYHVYSPKHPANPEDIGKWFVAEGWVNRFLYGVKGLSAEIQWIGTLPVTEFGKTLFFTKEAAEVALAERGETNV